MEETVRAVPHCLPTPERRRNSPGSTLLYCMGEEAEDVLTSTGISDEERKRYDAVMSKFDGFFKVRKNLIFERARFNQRNQSEGESVLYHLVETCEYGDLRNEMLRDRLVVAIRDSATSQKLQMDPGLTLEKSHEDCPTECCSERAAVPTEAAKRGQQGKPYHDRRGQDWSTSEEPPPEQR